MKRPLFLLGAIVGGLLSLLGPCWTAFGMIRAFRVLAQQGVGNPDELSAAIGKTLMGTAAGMIALPIGAVLCAYCIVRFLNLGKSSTAQSSTPAAPPNLP